MRIIKSHYLEYIKMVQIPLKLLYGKTSDPRRTKRDTMK